MTTAIILAAVTLPLVGLATFLAVWNRSLAKDTIAALAMAGVNNRAQVTAEAERNGYKAANENLQAELAAALAKLADAETRLNAAGQERADAIRQVTDAAGAARALDSVFAHPISSGPGAVPADEPASGHGATGPDAVQAAGAAAAAPTAHADAG